MPISPEITLAIQKRINATNSTNTVEVVNINNILNSYTPPRGYAFTDFNAFKIESLTASYILPSIPGINVPVIYPEDDEGTKAAKWNENLALAPSKILASYIDVGDGIWLQRSQVNLQNHGAVNVGIYSYYPLMSTLISDGYGYFGKNQRIGFGIKTSSNNTILGTGDVINIVGTIRFIPYLIESSQAFTGSNNFGVTVTPASPVQILPARSDRKELRLTTTENIWFRFGSSGGGVAKNQCPMLTKGGALTYENGRLAFEGNRGELSAISNTQGFSLWAIADSDTAIVSGEEFW
jgi:hypothetical protein